MEITARTIGDATISTTTSGKSVVNFTLALNDSYKTKEGKWERVTEFINCAYWLSTKVADSIKKGTWITVTGRIKAKAYINKSGDAVPTQTFHVNDLRLRGSSGNSQSSVSTPPPTVTNKEQADDLPF